jgi:hypothetical protein
VKIAFWLRPVLAAGLALAGETHSQGGWMKAASQPFPAPGNAFNYNESYPVYRLAIGSGNAVFAAGPRGLHRSSPSLASWTLVVGDGFGMSNALAADASGLVLFNSRVSWNGGNTFAPLASTIGIIPTAFAIHGRTVLTGGYYNHIYGSGDRAQTFTLLRGGPDVAHPMAFKVGPTGRIFSGLMSGGIYFSDDSGRTWNNHAGPTRNDSQWGFIPPGAGGLTCLEILPDGGILAGYSGPNSLFRISSDLKTSAPSTGGFPRSGVSDMVRGPKGMYFASTYGSGVWSSSDGGLTWKPLDSGSGVPFTLALAADSESTLYAMTREGLFLLRAAEGPGTTLRRTSHEPVVRLAGSGFHFGRFLGGYRLDGRSLAQGRLP